MGLCLSSRDRGEGDQLSTPESQAAHLAVKDVATQAPDVDDGDQTVSPMEPLRLQPLLQPPHRDVEPTAEELLCLPTVLAVNLLSGDEVQVDRLPVAPVAKNVEARLRDIRPLQGHATRWSCVRARIV